MKLFQGKVVGLKSGEKKNGGAPYQWIYATWENKAVCPEGSCAYKFYCEGHKYKLGGVAKILDDGFNRPQLFEE